MFKKPNENFVIEGSAGARNLTGELKVGGAKNAALKVLASSLLFTDPIKLTNVPRIDDIKIMIDLLNDLGQNADFNDKTVRLGGKKITKTSLNEDLSHKLRASIVLTGPLLGRTGGVSFPHPGGCVIGQRPIDIFLNGFQAMGAKIHYDQNKYHLSAPNGLKGARIFFPQQSVTGTETLLMAAVLASGTTVLDNAALEPEVVSLGQFLINAGAKIHGLGTPTITVSGLGGPLAKKDHDYQTIPDRIEAGSYLILGALAGKDILISHCEPRHLTAVTETLKQMGLKMNIDHSSIRVNNEQPEFRAINLKTHEYPGFPTDLQAPMAVLLTQAYGQSFIFETIFENRLSYLDTLNRQGADTMLLDAHRALINGPRPLKGESLDSPDLRAGLAYIIAALVASGRSIVHNIHYIDRGYEKVEKKLQAVGANIKRVSCQG